MSLVLPIALLPTWLAQAQAAPADPGPAEPAPTEAAAESAAPVHRQTVGVAGGMAKRLGGGDEVSDLGLAVDVFLAHTYLRLGGAIAFAAQLDFGFDRYSRTGPAPAAPPGMPSGTREVTVSHYDAVVLQTVALERRVRPWIGAGGGVAIGYASREVTGGPPEAELRMVRPTFQAAAGADVEIKPQTALGLRVDYARPLRPPSVTDGARRWSPFGDRLVARLALLYRF